jgi:outer membrane immunogenic protein
MKALVLAAIALIASGGAALAANAATPVVTPGPFNAPPAFPVGPTATPGPFDAPPAYPRIQVYDWTGFYIGINGGGAFGTTDWTSPLAANSASLSGGLVGGTVGYNLQANEPFVVGVEADFDWADINGTATGACVSNCGFRSAWFDTARLRFGYAFDRFLPYITGGIAFASLNAESTGGPFGTQGAEDLGWTAGVGLEFVISGPLRAKVEYQHAGFGSFTCTAACGGGPVSFNLNEDIVRAGLNYRFWMN